MLPSTADVDREVRLHAEALRGLARDLLRDPHAADDVTQQTLHKALAQRDLRAGPLGGWLRTVLENFARQWRRSERRRDARRARLATPEPEPCPSETLARRESLQTVTDAVLQLEEPYQTTVFLRYFEDLPPRAIARRTGANLATVKSRLQRGLGMLRQRLDRQRGAPDWRRALALTFGLPLATGALTVTTGAWIMGSTTKVLFAAGVLCAGGWFAFQMLDDPPPAPVGSAAKSGDAGAAVAAVVPHREADGTTREQAPELAPVEPWLEHPFEFELEVSLVDPTGLPIEQRTPGLAPFRVDRNSAAVATGPDGRALLTWRSRQPTGEVIVTDDAGVLHRVALRHGQRSVLTLEAPLPATAEASQWLAIEVLSEGTLKAVPLVGQFFRSVDGGSAMAPGLHPHALFQDDSAVVTAAPGVDVAAGELRLTGLQLGEHVTARLRVESFSFTRHAASDLVVQSTPPPAPAPAGVEGMVFDEEGKPAPDTPVALLGSGPQPLQRTTTDTEGRFSFDASAGTYTVRAGGEARGLAAIRADVTQGHTPVQPCLRRDAHVAGRLVHDDGRPVGKAKLAWRATDGSWCDATSTADDGTFVFANLPAVPGNVFVWPEGSGTLPTVIAHRVVADGTALTLRHDADSCRSLLVEPVLPPDCESARVEVRVWQEDSGLGVDLATPEAGKPWTLAHLPPGWYRVEVRAQGAGFVDLGRHLLDGNTDCDLGCVPLPVPGHVRFQVAEQVLPESRELRAFEVCEVRPDLDVRIAAADFPPDRIVHLPAGTYVFGYRHRDGGVRFVKFTVRSGQETIVAVET